MNFPFKCSNIPAAPAYGVCISQLIRYSRACGPKDDTPGCTIEANDFTTLAADFLALDTIVIGVSKTLAIVIWISSKNTV